MKDEDPSISGKESHDFKMLLGSMWDHVIGGPEFTIFIRELVISI